MTNKISRPLSAPGSPRDRSGMMTPGDFASLQEGMEGLSTEDYIAWKLPEEEDPDEYPFPLTLRAKRGSNASAGQMDGADDVHPGLNGAPGSPKGASVNGLLEAVNRS
jgi:glycogen(starch) synthase